MKKLSLILVVVLGLPVFAGNDSGHGGDPLAIEFVSRGQYILRRLRTSEAANQILTSEEIQRFEVALRTTRIELVEQKIIDPVGGLVTSVVLNDPLNPGRKMIRLHKESWREALYAARELNRFVFHEYLRVIGVDDDHYEVSTKFAEAETITQLDGNIYFSELIESPIFPFSPPVQVGDPRQGCELENKPTVQEDKARIAFNEKYLEWLSNLEANVRANLGPGATLNRVITPNTVKSAVESVTAARSSYYGCNVKHGVVVRENVSVQIKATTNQVIKEMKVGGIRGQLYYFTHSAELSQAEFLKRYVAISASFKKACTEWKAEMRKTFASRFIFADCGEQVRKFDRKLIRGSLSQDWYTLQDASHEATVYFIPQQIASFQ